VPTLPPLEFVDEGVRGRALDEIEADLIVRGMLQPLRLGGVDERAWMDCDLASMAENRIGDNTPPGELTDALRERWHQRAMTEPLWSASRRSKYERLYWLQRDGQRVGTLGLSAGVADSAWVRVASLYVQREHRGQGTARTVLGELRSALQREGLGVRLETNWTWQPALRMYLRMGMWVHMWKRELVLRWDVSTPAPILEFDGDRASLSVELDGTRTMLAQASREGERLVLGECPPSDHPEVEELRWSASSTFVLGLAMHGWPMVRSPKDWDRSRIADAGPPEALAYRITLWEAWSHTQGWTVDTPRIPGLDYPTWDEYQARWAREDAEYE
jgi:GNAT superfamily N-acetyltransferase